MFARADANKDGKLTKDEVANLAWSNFSKADVHHNNAVTKDELLAYFKQQFAASHGAGRSHEHAAKDHQQKKQKTHEKKESKPAKKKPAEKSPQKAPEKAAEKSAPVNSEPKAAGASPAIPASRPASKAAVSERAKLSTPPSVTASPRLDSRQKQGEAKNFATPNRDSVVIKQKTGTSATFKWVATALFAARRLLFF